MIRKACDIKLFVRPVLLGVEHRFFYEGPCRFGKGEELEVGFDRIGNAMRHDEFLQTIQGRMPENVELLEPLRVSRTDNWENKEQVWEDFKTSMADADAAFFFSVLGADDITVEFAERFDTPMLINPTSAFSPQSIVAAVKAKDPAREIYAPLHWTDAMEILDALRACKVIRSTNILLASRFNSDVSMSSVDTFSNHDLVTKNLGVHFRYINVHELLDDMMPARPEGNYTTPGRVTWNITEEELAECGRIADELMAGAEEVEISREYLINSLKAFMIVRKRMDEKDCNGFTVPCPDVCSTRRINEMKFTFCMTHSLNMEAGIPSSCEFDANAVLSQQALIAVSNHRPFVGNTGPIPYDYERKEWMYVWGPQYETVVRVAKDNPENIYIMEHSVPHRCLRDPNEKGKYALRHFAWQQEFGAVFRYDFEQDVGQTVTVCRFSPDGSKLLVGRGTVIAGDGYELQNCNGTILFRVKDQRDFWEKQVLVGNHLALVYGDYTRQLSRLAKVLGIEELRCY